jgi:hypothetical protein
MLHTGRRPVCARERGVKFGDAIGGNDFQLIGAEKILHAYRQREQFGKPGARTT